MRSIQLIPRQVRPRDATAFKGKVHQLFAELFWRRLIISLWNGPRHRHRFVIFSVAISSVSDFILAEQKIESVSARIIEYSRIALEMVASLQGFFKKRRFSVWSLPWIDCFISQLEISSINLSIEFGFVFSLNFDFSRLILFSDSPNQAMFAHCNNSSIYIQSVSVFFWLRFSSRFERQKPICVWFNEKTHIPKWSIIRSGHQ